MIKLELTDFFQLAIKTFHQLHYGIYHAGKTRALTRLPMGRQLAPGTKQTICD
jgi:hypothetical protein